MRKIKAMISVIVLVVFIVASCNYSASLLVKASEGNEERNYEESVDDQAGLLTDIEVIGVQENLKDFNQYGNAYVITTNEEDPDVKATAEAYYATKGKNAENGVVELINMKERQVYFVRYGELLTEISDDEWNEVVDLAVAYLKDEQYANAITEPFALIEEICEKTDDSSKNVNDTSASQNQTDDIRDSSSDVGETKVLKQENLSTGHVAIVVDDASILTESEKTKLLSDMMPLTEYGSVLFCSTEAYVYDAVDLDAQNKYKEYLGEDDGTEFYINMNVRKIWIANYGSIKKVITTNYSNSIADNVYKLATKGKYYECASNAYKQEGKLLAGQNISQPMKHISNALLGLIAAMFVNFGLVWVFSRPRAASKKEILNAIQYSVDLGNPRTIKTGKEKIYSPINSGYDGSSGGSSGGGGGFSGGGHDF